LQVHWARYPPHNRADDIVVTLRDSGKSALVSHPETARLAYVLMLTGMFVVAVMSWVAGFAIARWLRLWPDASFVHACGLAWLVGVAPATLTIVLLFVPVAIIETFNSLTAWRLPYADITESELLISALAFCTAGALAGWLLIFGRGRGRQTAAGLALLGLLAVVLLSHARKDSLAIEGVGMLIISLAILAAAIWCAARGVRAARQRVAPGPVYWGTVFWAVAASSVTYVLGVVGLTVLLDAVTPI
jgi:Na+-transporting methylmalonyl-CoA/oxaloacetate decarboxylase gamma subunit